MHKAGFFHQMPVRALMVGAGVAGLAGLALAVFGPKRFANEIALPLRDKTSAVLAPKAEKLWDEFQAALGSIKSEAARARILGAFQAWLDRFRSA